MNLVMATVVPATGSLEDAEAEPVLFDLDSITARLMLDDGTELIFDRAELAVALEGAQVRRAA